MHIRTAVMRVLLTGSAKVNAKAPFAFSRRRPPIIIKVTDKSHITTSIVFPTNST
jgi:hypothetical protein